jgi:hypothetical protein
VAGRPELFRQNALSPKVSQCTLPEDSGGLISGTLLRSGVSRVRFTRKRPHAQLICLPAMIAVLAGCSAFATRPDGGSQFLDALFGAAGPTTPGTSYAAPPPQTSAPSNITCFTQPAPGGATTNCVPAINQQASRPAGLQCFTQQAPGGGATTTCLPQ